MRRRPMRTPSKPFYRGLLFAAVALASLSFGLGGASSDVLPITYTIEGVAGTNGWFETQE